MHSLLAELSEYYEKNPNISLDLRYDNILPHWRTSALIDCITNIECQVNPEMFPGAQIRVEIAVKSHANHAGHDGDGCDDDFCERILYGSKSTCRFSRPEMH